MGPRFAKPGLEEPGGGLEEVEDLISLLSALGVTEASFKVFNIPSNVRSLRGQL